MVRYFEKSLKPSIKAEIDQNATYLDDYEELLAKVVRVKAKTGLQPSWYLQETDLQVLRGIRPAHTSAQKVQTQGAITCRNKSRTKVLASTPAQDFEPSDKSRKSKKKKKHRDKKNSKELKEDSTIPASGVNAAKVNRSGKSSRKNKKDLSGVMCYNFNKKRYFADKC